MGEFSIHWNFPLDAVPCFCLLFLSNQFLLLNNSNHHVPTLEHANLIRLDLDRCATHFNV